MPRTKKVVVVAEPVEELVEDKPVVEPVVAKPVKAKAAKAGPVIVDEEKPAPKEKKTRTPSEYNLLLGEFMRKIAMDSKDLPEDQKVPRGERMKMAQKMYREWKEKKNSAQPEKQAEAEPEPEAKPEKKVPAKKAGKGKKSVVVESSDAEN